MIIFVALLYLVLVILLGSSFATVALPMFIGGVLLFLADTAGRQGPAHFLWQVYTAVTAVRGTIIIALNQILGEPMDLAGLCSEYLVITAIAMGWWIVRESRSPAQNVRIRRKHTRPTTTYKTRRNSYG